MLRMQKSILFGCHCSFILTDLTFLVWSGEVILNSLEKCLTHDFFKLFDFQLQIWKCITVTEAAVGRSNMIY